MSFDHTIRGRSSKNGATLILIFTAAVAILALAASSRPSEFLAITDFASSEEYLSEGSLRAPSKRGQLLREEAEEMRAELRDLPISRSQLDEDSPLTAEEIDDNAVIWASNHPEEHSSIQIAFVLGALIGLIGLIMLLVSELKTVLVVRELDRDVLSECPKTSELEESERRWAGGMSATFRPWFSFGGLATMLIGGLVVLVPLCDVLADFGLPGATNNDDCVTTVVIVAVVGTIAVSSMLVGVVWSCTRPYSAMVLVAISFGAQISMSVGSPLLILAWAIFSGWLLYYYFYYIPEAQEGYNPFVRADSTRQPLKPQPRGSGARAAAHYQGESEYV